MNKVIEGRTNASKSPNKPLDLVVIAGATGDCEYRTGISCWSDAYAPDIEPSCWEKPTAEKEKPATVALGCLTNNY